MGTVLYLFTDEIIIFVLFSELSGIKQNIRMCHDLSLI